ncbi:hypothetical protein EV361DRAFT_948315 [Lentinula raphanica]|uniref:Uncharacterized protein n=1 Tax=Lentinula raphanica TaxID=153919 RepID=A0AA38NVF1_9AGAR|nr:hypothetical protein F5878DRAFT_667630 [Lentinula raphanica]KAJ3972951.1 hypothetical protein EV361DRAFT_948315 [Lentinula raphanica]
MPYYPPQSLKELFAPPQNLTYCEFAASLMAPFIQQPHCLYYSPARIPTFDHGLRQTVFVRPPVNRFGDRVPLKKFRFLRKAGGMRWEYYCDCTPPADKPGVPMHCYEVTKLTSPYYGNVYLACGKTNHRCNWKIRLNKIYKAHDVEISIRPSNIHEGDSTSSSDDLPSQLAEGSQAENKDADAQSPASSPCGPSVPLNAEDRDFDDEKFNEAFDQLMAQLQITEGVPSNPPQLSEQELAELLKDLEITGGIPSNLPQLSEQELAELLKELALNDGNTAADPDVPASQNNQMVWNEIEEEWELPAHAYEELCAAFAGQDDVLVTPDGSIHYIPKDSQGSVDAHSDANGGDANDDEDMRWEDDDVTLIESSTSSIEKAKSSTPLGQDDMFVDLMIDDFNYLPSSSRKPIVRYLSPVDLTMEEPSEKGFETFGTGTSVDPFDFTSL